MSSTDGDAELRKQGKRCLRKGEYDEAVRIYRQVIESHPNDVPAHEGLAAAYFARNEYDAAIETFERITRLDPKQGRALINLGAVYNRMGDFKKALDVLRRGVQKDRSCAQGYYNMGLAHRGLKQSAMAVSAYREAIRLDPQMAEAHQNLANVFVDMKNYRQAIRHYESALQLNPDFERARLGLEAVRQAVEQQQLQASPFGRLVESSPKSEKPLSAGSIRQLTDEEREHDRAAIAAIVIDIERAAAELAAHVRERVEPCILKLNRAVSQGQKGAFSVVDAAEEFDECTSITTELREQVVRSMAQLKQHTDANLADNQA